MRVCFNLAPDGSMDASLLNPCVSPSGFYLGVFPLYTNSPLIGILCTSPIKDCEYKEGHPKFYAFRVWGFGVLACEGFGLWGSEWVHRTKRFRV